MRPRRLRHRSAARAGGDWTRDHTPGQAQPARHQVGASPPPDLAALGPCPAGQRAPSACTRPGAWPRAHRCACRSRGSASRGRLRAFGPPVGPRCGASDARRPDPFAQEGGGPRQSVDGPREDAERGRSLAAHGPPDEPDDHQLGPALRRGDRLAARQGSRERAARQPVPALPPARGRERRPTRGRLLGGRPALRSRRAHASPRPAGARRPRRVAGVGRRPDGRAARSREAALALLPDRRLRRGLRPVRTHAPLHRRWDRAGARAALAHRLRAGRGHRAVRPAAAPADAG